MLRFNNAYLISSFAQTFLSFVIPACAGIQRFEIYKSATKILTARSYFDNLSIISLYVKKNNNQIIK